jgi:uncharacterized membrane protein YfcA
MGTTLLHTAFAGATLLQLLPVAGVALFASILGGVTGYGTGALMPLVLVPLIGAEPVVPIIAISALFTNAGRAAAFRSFVDPRRALLVLAGAIPLCIVTAYGYTRLNNRGALIVIGAMLVLTVPLRRVLRSRDIRLGDRGLAFSSVGWGALVGGTTGAGIVLLSLLMAAGLQGAAVIATDAAISIVIGVVRLSVFGLAGAVTPQVLAYALLIGLIALPGAFLARAFVQRLPLHVHGAILDGVVVFGGAAMLYRAMAG